MFHDNTLCVILMTCGFHLEEYLQAQSNLKGDFLHVVEMFAITCAKSNREKMLIGF